MKYLCLAYYNVEKFRALGGAEMKALVSRCPPHDAALRDSGKLVLQGALGSLESGACIRPRGGKPTVTDGPFVETHEQVGGMFIVEAASLAEAVEVAKNHPAAHLGEEVGWGIEVRAIKGLQEY